MRKEKPDIETIALQAELDQARARLEHYQRIILELEIKLKYHQAILNRKPGSQ